MKSIADIFHRDCMLSPALHIGGDGRMIMLVKGYCAAEDQSIHPAGSGRSPELCELVAMER